MFSRAFKWIGHHLKRSLILISLLIVLLDICFILINYHASRTALLNQFNAQAREQEREFGLTLQMTYRNMMQMALYISQNDELNQLFLAGKKNIESSDFNHSSPGAVAARQALLDRIKPAWDKLTSAFDIRQLHYHLGPRSVSFLRVHKPQKFGDRLDDIRPIIVDTNQDLKPRYGFETGRIYSGLRGVYPIRTYDQDAKRWVHVGALEAGTSLKQILPSFASHFDSQVAVLLSKSHVEDNMWPEFIDEYFAENPDINYYIEATSSPKIKQVLAQISVAPDFKASQVQLIKMDNADWSVFYFPFFDYKGSRAGEPVAAGMVVIWDNVTAVLATFKRDVMINILFALLALIIIESALVWLFRREKRLKLAETDAHTDALTHVYNRRHYDALMAEHLINVQQTGAPLSMIICDIDFFKIYNDTFGHTMGDECLKKISAAIKRQTRRVTDNVVRYGGEEFVVILANTPITDAIKTAESIRHAIESLAILNPGSPAAEVVTVSLGVASISSQDTEDDLFKMADHCLYEAKNRGRNQVWPSP